MRRDLLFLLGIGLFFEGCSQSNNIEGIVTKIEKDCFPTVIESQKKDKINGTKLCTMYVEYSVIEVTTKDKIVRVFIPNNSNYKKGDRFNEEVSSVKGGSISYSEIAGYQEKRRSLKAGTIRVDYKK